MKKQQHNTITLTSTAAVILSLSHTSEAFTIAGIDYNLDVLFPGIVSTDLNANASIFAPGGMSFSLPGTGGWTVTVEATSNVGLVGLSGVAEENLNASLGAPNLVRNQAFQPGEAFEDPAVRPGVFLQQVTNMVDVDPDPVVDDLVNTLISTTFTFQRTAGLPTLDATFYSGESVDSEIDTLSHSNGVFSISNELDLPTITGDGTGMVSLTGMPGQSPLPGGGTGRLRGGYFASTVINPGDSVTWGLDYIGTGAGDQQISLSVAIPEPSSTISLGLAGMLFLGRRKRG